MMKQMRSGGGMGEMQQCLVSQMGRSAEIWGSQFDEQLSLSAEKPAAIMEEGAAGVRSSHKSLLPRWPALFS